MASWTAFISGAYLLMRVKGQHAVVVLVVWGLTLTCIQGTPHACGQTQVHACDMLSDVVPDHSWSVLVVASFVS